MMAVGGKWHVIVAKLTMLALDVVPFGISVALHSDLSEFF
jgi:hypothetical protein